MRYGDLLQLMKEIECEPFEFDVGCNECGLVCSGALDHLWWIEATLQRPDTHTGLLSIGRGGRIYIVQDCSRDTVIKKFFVAARDYAEHEVREAFHWRGKRILGPHVAISDLWEIT